MLRADIDRIFSAYWACCPLCINPALTSGLEKCNFLRNERITMSVPIRLNILVPQRFIQFNGHHGRVEHDNIRALPTTPAKPCAAEPHSCNLPRGQCRAAGAAIMRTFALARGDFYAGSCTHRTPTGCADAESPRALPIDMRHLGGRASSVAEGPACLHLAVSLTAAGSALKEPDRMRTTTEDATPCS